MNLQSIISIQDRIRKDISFSLTKKNYTKVFYLADTFADVTQRINNIFRDEVVESAVSLIGSSFSLSIKSEPAEEESVLFYDLVGTTRCLELQYLRGLIASGYKVSYIYVNNTRKISNDLLNFVITSCASYHIFNNTNLYEKWNEYGNRIVEVIRAINPQKIFVHPAAAGSFGISLLYAFPKIEKFRIIPGDHHFYIGYDCFQHFIEFRPLGVSLDVFERNINPSQINILPYYPIIDSFSSFAGFPEESNNKIIVLSAGAEYKFVGSDVFYKLSRFILSRPNTALIYLGKPSKKIVRFSKSKDAHDRFFILGYRNDFVECVKHCDFVLNSYPAGGGLVCQTSAFFSKPIVHYCEAFEHDWLNVEDVLGPHNYEDSITITSWSRVQEYISRLITDVDFRYQEGDRQKELLQTVSCFNYNLNLIVKNTTSCLLKVTPKQIDRSPWINLYISIQNTWKPTVLIPLISFYRFKFFFVFRFLWKDVLLHLSFVLKHFFAVILHIKSR